MVIGYLQGSRVCHIARMVGCCSNREEVSRSLGGGECRSGRSLGAIGWVVGLN